MWQWLLRANPLCVKEKPTLCPVLNRGAQYPQTLTHKGANVSPVSAFEFL